MGGRLGGPGKMIKFQKKNHQSVESGVWEQGPQIPQKLAPKLQKHLNLWEVDGRRPSILDGFHSFCHFGVNFCGIWGPCSEPPDSTLWLQFLWNLIVFPGPHSLPPIGYHGSRPQGLKIKPQGLKIRPQGLKITPHGLKIMPLVL